MVRETPEHTYKCEACGLAYLAAKQARACEAWCCKHTSCNIALTRLAVNKKEVSHEEV